MLSPQDCAFDALLFVASSQLATYRRFRSGAEDYQVPDIPVSSYHKIQHQFVGESDGDESDEYGCVPSSSSRSPPKTHSSASKSQSKVSAASAHNEVEKRRRAFLTKCYKKLHGTVPTISGSKASNVLILQKATEHIHELAMEERVLVNAKADLMRMNQELREKWAAAQTAASDSGMSGSSNEEYGTDEDSAVVPDTLRSSSPSLSPQADYSQLYGAAMTATKKPAKVSGKHDSLLLLANVGGTRAAGKRTKRLRNASRNRRAVAY